MAIPHDVLKLIVTYLPYNDRVEANKYLPLEYQVIRKLDSDSHNLRVKIMLLDHKLSKIREQHPDSLNAVRLTTQLFDYLTQTKDDCLFVMTTTNLHAMLRGKASFSRLIYDEHDWIHRKFRRDIRLMNSSIDKFIQKIDSKTPATKERIGKCVTFT